MTNSLVLKERSKYTKDELREKFEKANSKPLSDNDWTELLSFLIKASAIKEPSDKKKEITINEFDEDDEDRENADKYSIEYVGLVVFKDWVIKFYPKYFKFDAKEKEPSNHYDKFKQVLKVIKKYNKSNMDMSLYGNVNQSVEMKLSIIVRLLDDYFENGCYENDRIITKINGSGEIDWNRTVNCTYPYILDGRPIYFDYYTRSREKDTDDFFNRLHKCIITECSLYLDEHDLSDLLDLSTIVLSEEERSNFGDDSFILERINSERSVQFNTKKLEMLDMIEAYINITNDVSLDKMQLYGTYSFQTIWEDVCKKVFDDDLKKEIPKEQKDNYYNWLTLKKYPNHYDNAKYYKDIVEKPKWIDINDKEYKPDSTLKLDCIKFDLASSRMDIYDAKYYVPNTTDDKIKDSPRVSDVTKQYLYQLAYKRFADALGIKNISNSFLMPSDEDKSSNWGTVSMSMFEFDEFGLQKINVVYLCAEKMYDSYLDDKKNGIYIMNNQQDAIVD